MEGSENQGAGEGRGPQLLSHSMWGFDGVHIDLKAGCGKVALGL